MNIFELINITPGEKPLDRMTSNGGFCGIFRTIGCIGDSLSSGEFESMSAEGEHGYHDMFDYSWGQHMTRDIGCRVYNFSRGGMTASEYWNSFAEENGFWAEDKLCQAYIIALGVNDVFGLKQEIGTVDDIDIEDYTKNKDTFAGYYGKIIQRLKAMQPGAVFFLMSMPRENDVNDAQREAHALLLDSMTRLFSDTYIIDLFKYAPAVDAEYRSRFYMGGHMNSVGYLLTARMTESYIDYIIRKNPAAFGASGFIGTPLTYIN